MLRSRGATLRPCFRTAKLHIPTTPTMIPFTDIHTTITDYATPHTELAPL